MSVFKSFKMTRTRKIAIAALLVSIGTVLQIVENMFDFFTVPGGKIGLSNIATLLCLFIFGGKESVLVAFLRAVLGSMLYGGAAALPYSLCGAVLSALCMWGLKAAFFPRLGQIGISVLGAAVHNAAQVAVAAVIMGSLKIFSYLGVLLICGTLGGIVTGAGALAFCKKAGID